MVIEDDTDLAQVITTTLARHGLHVSMASGAGDAVDLSKVLVPDLLVLDVGLAEGDGYEVVARLRGDERLARLPVIVFTGRDLDEHDRERLRLGPTEFLIKGHSSVESLEERVLRVLTDGSDAPVPASPV